jgi:hypothetical protein
MLLISLDFVKHWMLLQTIFNQTPGVQVYFCRIFVKTRNIYNHLNLMDLTIFLVLLQRVVIEISVRALKYIFHLSLSQS